MCCSEEAGYPGFALLEFAEGSDKVLGPQRKVFGADLQSLRVSLHAMPREAILFPIFNPERDDSHIENVSLTSAIRLLTSAI